MDNQQRMQKMTALLQKTLSPTDLKIIDESHLHAGHAGAKSGKGHFKLLIKSHKFSGLSKIKQHQLIYQALGELMQTDIHALSIKTEF